MNVELKVHLARDEETGWWYVAASDIPGLVLEAETPGSLIEKIEAAAPEMIELNMDEIIANHARTAGPAADTWHTGVALAYRPVFDSPLRAHA